jgi:hypothetical protein
MDVTSVLQFTWPGSFTTIYRQWDQVEDLQGFLDSEVDWVSGQERTAAEILAAEPAYDAAVAAASAQRAQDEADVTETKQDTVINAILNSTNAEINTYVETNITNITEAQEAFKKVFKLFKVLYIERGA